MHMETDHACNMINNFVCFMLVGMRVPCTKRNQPAARMGNHKSHAMPTRAQSDGHDDAQMIYDTRVPHMSIIASVIYMLEVHGVCVRRAYHTTTRESQPEAEKPPEAA